MLRSHTLAATLVLTLACAISRGGPPVQYERVIIAEGLIDPSEIALSRLQMNDSGQLAVTIISDSGERSIATRLDDEWEWIFPPYTPEEGQLVGEPALYSVFQLVNSGRVFVELKLVFPYPQPDIWTVREYTPFNGGWTQRDVIQGQGGVSSWAANNSNSFAWLQYHPEGSLRIEREGTVSTHPYPGAEDATSLLQLYDNEHVFMEFQIFPDAWETHNSYTDEWTYMGGVWSNGNDIGDDVFIMSTHNVWGPVGESVTPPYSMLASETPFGSFGTAALSNSGEVIFDAVLDDGRFGLFLGPDPVNDALVLSPITIHGHPIAQLSPLGLTPDRTMLVSALSPTGETTLYLATICPADVNRDGIIDNGDIGDFITLYLEGSMRTDFNNDALLDNGDITEFITQFLNGC